MNVIYESKHFQILAFPDQQGFELIDKCWSRALYVDGIQATQFCRLMTDLPQWRRTHENIDELLDEICDESAQPVTMH